MKKRTSTAKIGKPPIDFSEWRVWDDELQARALAGESHAQAVMLERHYHDLARELPPSNIAWSAPSLRNTKVHIAKAWAAVFAPTQAAKRLGLMKAIDYLARYNLHQEGGLDLVPELGAIGAIVRVWLDEMPGAKQTGAGTSKWRMLASHFAKQGQRVTPERLKKDWLAYKKANGE